MKNIFLFPTDKPSRLRYNLSNVLVVTKELYRDYGKEVNQNIYITSDEEIKEGEYGLSKLGEIIKFHSGYDYRYYAKIILTDNPDLIKNGVQAIDDEFLEWFVKNPSCEFVEIDRDEREIGNHLGGVVIEYGDYKIIIPKEEQCTCEVGHPYNNLCCKVHGSIPKEQPIMVDKLKEYLNNTPKEQIQKDWEESCKQVEGVISPTIGEFIEAQRRFNKQETLEEAAKRVQENFKTSEEKPYELIFTLGAKWQAERMYSEEEVIKIAKQYARRCQAPIQDSKWFEQFKKK
jgi:hypothetical protein